MFTALAIFILVSATLAIGTVLGVAITFGAAKPHRQAFTGTTTAANDIGHPDRDASLSSGAFKRAA
jgi:hypothetical protein